MPTDTHSAIRIAVVAGSTRPGRRAAVIAQWARDLAGRHPAVAAGDVVLETVDLADRPLPLLDEAMPAIFGQYQNPHTLAWAATIRSYDGFLFVVPEYNHSFPATLKNAIDYLFAEWHHKAAGFVSYGAHGGHRAVEHLRGVLAEVKVATVRTQVGLSLYTDFQLTSPTEPGTLAPAPQHEGTFLEMLDEVVTWSRALAPLRQPVIATSAVA
jgi:NAD(P)H-dependent FMN reductase